MGALLDLHIGFGYVLSHDTQAEKLQAADEDDDTDSGSPAWDRIIEDQLSDDDGYQDQKGKTGHGRSEPGGDGQPAFGFIQPITTSSILDCTNAPEHI